MQIDIQTLGFTLTDALREHTHSRLGFALAHGAETIDRVTVRLSDINGPRGGADKRCHIHVAVAHQADVVIEDIQADMYVAPRRLHHARRGGRHHRGHCGPGGTGSNMMWDMVYAARGFLWSLQALADPDGRLALGEADAMRAQVLAFKPPR